MKKSIIFSTFIFVVHIAFAQVRTAYFPEGNALQEVELLKNVRTARTVQMKKTMPAFDIQPLMDEDKENEMDDRPFQFGKGFDTDFTLKDGVWTDVENGRLWSMQFKSEGAYSINFVFDDFYLSKNAILYVVNANKTMLYGPVTSAQNPKNGYFLTDLIMGDDVTVYLFEPYSEKGKSKLTIKRVVHAYKNLFYSEAYGNFEGSLRGCHNDIQCFPNWSNESDAVALVLLSSGTEKCSGSLLMNTAQDFKPYFLSAFHCVDSEAPHGGNLSASEVSRAENWLFKFQYKLSSCGGSSPTAGITYNGAKLRAAWDGTDFALLELDNMVHGDGRFSWLGWDRTGNIPRSGKGIHHPAGDVMKISFGNKIYSYNDRITWNYKTTSEANTHWAITFNNGGAEGGSSGSPLLDQNRRVVGLLHGGHGTCPPVTKYYGKFDKSWVGGGTDDTGLRKWLDPSGTNQKTLNSKSNCELRVSGTFDMHSCYRNPLVTNQPIKWGGALNFIRGHGCRTEVHIKSNTDKLTCIPRENSYTLFVFQNRGNGRYCLTFDATTCLMSFDLNGRCGKERLSFWVGNYDYSFMSSSKTIKIDMGMGMENENRNIRSLSGYKFTIIGVDGNIVKDVTKRGSSFEISVSELNKGIYFLNIYDLSLNQQIGSERFVVN